MTTIGWLGEKAGRLKPNGYVVRRSPLADVVELEGLRNATHLELCGWQVIRAFAVHDDRVDVVEVERLIERSEDRLARLHTLHLQAVQANLVS
jgi:hypothetical protein